MATAAPHISSDKWTPRSPQVVGPSFASQYYRILIEAPHQIQKFYRNDDSSSASVSADYLAAINERVTAMDVASVDVRTVETKESRGGGLTVLVTGSLTGRRDGRRRGFSQSFFLGPQRRGYVLTNDVFRYTGDDHGPAAAPAKGTATAEHAAPQVAPQQGQRALDMTGSDPSLLKEENMSRGAEQHGVTVVSELDNDDYVLIDG